MALSFVCRLKRVLVGHWPAWPSSTIVLAAVSGAALLGPAVRPVPDILMIIGLTIWAAVSYYKEINNDNQTRKPKCKIQIIIIIIIVVYYELSKRN